MPRTSEARSSGRALSVLVAGSILIGTSSAPAFAQSYNLTSPAKTEAPTVNSPTAIRVDGRTMLVSNGTMLTPAQALALAQVASTGNQSLLLGANGTAIGGLASINAVSGISSLIIPHNVSIIGNFTTANTLNVVNNILNSGALYAMSNSPNSANATFQAQNITNMLGGLISSVKPTNIPGFENAIGNLSLSLVAANKVSNMGTISSANQLSISTPQLTIPDCCKLSTTSAFQTPARAT